MKKASVCCCMSIVLIWAFGSDPALGQTVFCTGYTDATECRNWCWANWGSDINFVRDCLDGCSVCSWECEEHSDCTAPTKKCYLTECVECFNNSHCGWNEVCRSRMCEVAECQDGSDCGPGETCSNGECEPLDTPVLISTRNDKFRLTSWQEGVYFDINADGLAERVAWTAAGTDDAFLVLDRNGNGHIDDATELFGNRTPQAPSADPNGFRALARFDAVDMGGNGDRRITSEDAVFGDLQLWFDRNHNGLSEPRELRPLFRFAAAIELDYVTNPGVDEHGNRFAYKTKVFRNNGKTRIACDVIFVVEPNEPREILGLLEMIKRGQ